MDVRSDVHSRHPDDDLLAEWAEGRLHPLAASACREHVVRCGRCLSAYEEILRARDGIRGPLPPAPEFVMAAGAAIASRRRLSVRARALARKARTWMLLVPVAALAVLLFLRVPGDRRDGPRDFEVPPALIEGVRAYSSHGLRLPGVGETRSTRGDPVYRSNDLATVEEILAAVRDVDARYEEKPSEPLAFWRAAGLLAAGQRGAVRATLAESLRQFPESASLRIVEAALAYQESDLAAARRILESLRQRHPANETVRLNLRLLEETEERESGPEGGRP